MLERCVCLSYVLAVLAVCDINGLDEPLKEARARTHTHTHTQGYSLTTPHTLAFLTASCVRFVSQVTKIVMQQFTPGNGTFIFNGVSGKNSMCHF